MGVFFCIVGCLGFSCFSGELDGQGYILVFMSCFLSKKDRGIFDYFELQY